MSDSIVLWRMHVVWNKSRPITALGVTLLLTILGLNVANIVGVARYEAMYVYGVYENTQDTEIVATYGNTPVGLAAAFMSLASNICATALVGIKFWCA